MGQKMVSVVDLPITENLAFDAWKRLEDGQIVLCTDNDQLIVTKEDVTTGRVILRKEEGGKAMINKPDPGGQTLISLPDAQLTKIKQSLGLPD